MLIARFFTHALDYLRARNRLLCKQNKKSACVRKKEENYALVRGGGTIFKMGIMKGVLFLYENILGGSVLNHKLFWKTTAPPPRDVITVRSLRDKKLFITLKETIVVNSYGFFESQMLTKPGYLIFFVKFLKWVTYEYEYFRELVS